jgi:hypothetical protein
MVHTFFRGTIQALATHSDEIYLSDYFNISIWLQMEKLPDARLRDTKPSDKNVTSYFHIIFCYVYL